LASGDPSDSNHVTPLEKDQSSLMNKQAEPICVYVCNETRSLLWPKCGPSVRLKPAVARQAALEIADLAVEHKMLQNRSYISQQILYQSRVNSLYENSLKMRIDNTPLDLKVVCMFTQK